MADEFVDFYEILELPVDAERSEVRKRISELYVEAQKNLDHRDFNKRVRNQQLFEVTLPQARYILLDDGRRDDYDRIVKVSRASSEVKPASADPVAPATSEPSTATDQKMGGFQLSPDERVAGAAPSIDALPDDGAPDPAAVERERAELWNKWKSGLQSAMEREASKEKEREGQAASAVPTPLADRIEAAASGAPQPAQAKPTPAKSATTENGAARETAANARTVGDERKAERPKVKFDFGGEPDNTPRRGEGAPTPGAEEFVEAAKSRLTPEQIEERRTNHRRAILKEELENTGVKGLFIGALAIVIPGVFAMVIFMSTYYPADKVSELPLKSSGVAWILWLLILAGLAYASGHFLSKSMRRKQGMELQMMSYEELLRHTNKDI